MTTRTEQGTQEVAEAGPWVERFARLGYLVKGIVYITVGLLAIQAALGRGGRTTGASGALLSIAEQPWGRVLLAVVAVGLVGYALWRAVQAILDIEHKGTDAKALLKRFGYLVSGLAYGSLALEAWRLLLRVGYSRSTQSQELWTARVLALPLGRWLVAGAAVVLFALAINAVVVAVGRMYRDKLKHPEMGGLEGAMADVTAIAGLIGRGAVFGVIGVFLVRAALFSDPQAAGSSAEALGAIAGIPYGEWVLGIVSAGLVFYGMFAMVQSRYRQMNL